MSTLVENLPSFPRAARGFRREDPEGHQLEPCSFSGQKLPTAPFFSCRKLRSWLLILLLPPWVCLTWQAHTSCSHFLPLAVIASVLGTLTFQFWRYSIGFPSNDVFKIILFQITIKSCLCLPFEWYLVYIVSFVFLPCLVIEGY